MAYERWQLEFGGATTGTFDVHNTGGGFTIDVVTNDSAAFIQGGLGGAMNPNGSTISVTGATGSYLIEYQQHIDQNDLSIINNTTDGSPSVTNINQGRPNPDPLSADAGSFVLTGNDAILRVDERFLFADAGSFLLTGEDATLIRTYLMLAETGEFALTGNDALMLQSKQLAAGAGSFLLNGRNASMVRALKLLAGAGSFVLTGNDALIISTVRPPWWIVERRAHVGGAVEKRVYA